VVSSTSRSTAASIAALERWAHSDPREGTQAARDASPGSLSYWERAVDRDGKLGPAERARRAERKRRAHFKRMALRSAQARRANKETR
jgi:hypothetical protein